MRAFSRLAPRVHTFAVASLRRSIVTSSCQLAVPAWKQLGVRNMSTETTQHMLEVLEAQIKEEEENSVEFDAIDNENTPEGWSMETADDSNLITFKSKYESEVITITCDAYQLESDESDVDQEQQEEIEAQHAEVDENEGSNYGAHVTIELVRGDKTLVCDAVAWSKSGFELTSVKPGAPNGYPGPRIDDLDEAVTEAFHEYLNERGVNWGLAAFIAAHAWRKEQVAYRGWLSAFQKFVK